MCVSILRVTIPQGICNNPKTNKKNSKFPTPVVTRKCNFPPAQSGKLFWKHEITNVNTKTTSLQNDCKNLVQVTIINSFPSEHSNKNAILWLLLRLIIVK